MKSGGVEAQCEPPCDVLESINIHSETERAQAWLQRFRGQPWSLICTLGFTETALIPGISAAGNTPDARRWTAIADSEFLHQGLASETANHPLPPLEAGLSPVLITRALVERGNRPVQIVNAGLPVSTPYTGHDLGGQPAACVSTGRAMSLAIAQHLFQTGLDWGQRLAQNTTTDSTYSVLGECVVGGTTTALALLTGLGIDARGRVNSSHPRCNHAQKQQLVDQGLRASGLKRSQAHPLAIAAAVGDPMQVFVAGLAIAASNHRGVLLAGGTQMLAVYALAAALSQRDNLPWNPDHIAVGTTRWVALDPSGDTPGLAEAIGKRWHPAPILLSTALDFSNSRHAALRAYEAGFVKEGVAAGGSAIATSLCDSLSVEALVTAVDDFCDRYQQWRQSSQAHPSQ